MKTDLHPKDRIQWSGYLPVGFWQVFVREPWTYRRIRRGAVGADLREARLWSGSLPGAQA